MPGFLCGPLLPGCRAPGPEEAGINGLPLDSCHVGFFPSGGYKSHAPCKHNFTTAERPGPTRSSRGLWTGQCTRGQTPAPSSPGTLGGPHPAPPLRPDTGEPVLVCGLLPLSSVPQTWGGPGHQGSLTGRSVLSPRSQLGSAWSPLRSQACGPPRTRRPCRCPGRNEDRSTTPLRAWPWPSGLPTFLPGVG